MPSRVRGGFVLAGVLLAGLPSAARDLKKTGTGALAPQSGHAVRTGLTRPLRALPSAVPAAGAADDVDA